MQRLGIKGMVARRLPALSFVEIKISGNNVAGEKATPLFALGDGSVAFEILAIKVVNV